MLRQCDTTFGDSGSPILLELEGRFSLVIVVTGINLTLSRGIAVTSKAFYDYLQIPQTPGDRENTSPVAC